MYLLNIVYYIYIVNIIETYKPNELNIRTKKKESIQRNKRMKKKLFKEKIHLTIGIIYY